MTVDERIEKLTERHEALAQSVELLTLSIHEQGDNIDKLLAASAAQGAHIEAQGEHIEAQGKHIDKILTLIEGLATLASNHQSRIEKLEGRES
jgi:hypothetical protein